MLFKRISLPFFLALAATTILTPPQPLCTADILQRNMVKSLNTYKPEYDNLAYQAAIKNDVVALERYLTLGVDVNASVGGNPLLCWAVDYGSMQAVMLLLVMGADVDGLNCFGDTPLIRAVWKGYNSIVKILLSNHANVDVARKKDKYTALHLAVLHENIDVIYALLRSGANCNMRSTDSNHPLSLLFDFNEARHGLKAVVSRPFASVPTTAITDF